MFRSLNELPRDILSSPIPKSSLFFWPPKVSPPSPPEPTAPGSEELLMYICLTKPQNTRKQNGNTGFPTTILKTPVPTAHLCKISKETRTSFCSRPGPRAGTLHIYYLKTLSMMVKTGTGLRGQRLRYLRFPLSCIL